jgi:hypothetical protein
MDDSVPSVCHGCLEIAIVPLKSLWCYSVQLPAGVLMVKGCADSVSIYMSVESLHQGPMKSVNHAVFVLVACQSIVFVQECSPEYIIVNVLAGDVHVPIECLLSVGITVAILVQGPCGVHLHNQ